MKKLCSRIAIQAIGLLALGVVLSVASRVHPADHGDAPIAGNNQSTDIADVYAFLDPNDNTRLILAMTQRGFIAAGENANFGIFDQFLQYRFQLQTTGDARPDGFIDITFTPVERSGGPQTATIELPSGQVFTAPSTRSSTAATAPAQVVTEDPETEVLFFAGLVDDPFFFDIPGFRSLRGLGAGRDARSYAVTARPRQLRRVQRYGDRAQRSPVAPAKSHIIIRVSGVIRRQETTSVGRRDFETSGRFRQVERLGNPAVNVALIPFSRKDEYNFATPVDDAAGRFVDDIVATLTALGTNATNIDIIVNVVATRGDYLRLDTRIANTGPRGGTNPAAGFPNGRRLADDTIDTLLFFINNQNVLGDSVDASDVRPRNNFPFFARSQQPREPGVIDDNTRN